MAVRLKDIADDLNLSKMTISKVLRGQTDISAETKERVLKRVQELRYIPNATAKSFRTGQTLTMGLILPSIREARCAEIAEGLAHAIHPNGYGLSIGDTQNNPDYEQRQVEFFLSRRVDALLIVSTQEANSFFEQINNPRKMHIVFIDCKPAGSTEGFVGIHQEEIGRIAIKHLVGCGCERIAYLRGPRTSVADLRYKGFRQALSDHGIAFQQNLVIDSIGTGESEYRRGFQMMQRLLDQRRRPQAVMAYTDMIALGAIDAALQNGLNVPNELIFLGSGNDPLLCQMRVPLSSIDISGQEMGQKAGRMALRMIGGAPNSATRKVLVAPRIVQRSSSTR
jgi:LacI family transcriptional regulator